MAVLFSFHIEKPSTPTIISFVKVKPHMYHQLQITISSPS